MVKTYTDAKYHFTETFDDADGTYIRSDVTEGPEKGHDPFMRSFPALMDIGIMGHCVHGKSGLCAKSGIQCYQSGQTMEAPNMTLENYARLVSEVEEKGCFQVALGGRGDPDMHEHFEDILRLSREHGVVPNFTTSGLGMTAEKAKLCKEYCGAVAVSWYSRLEQIVIAMPEEEAGTCRPIYLEAPVLVSSLTDEPDELCVICPQDGMRRSGKLYPLWFGEKEGCHPVTVYYETCPYTIQAAHMLLDAGVQVNVHFVIGKNTLMEAMQRVRYDLFPEGIHAIVFLLHKPVGQGTEENMLTVEAARPFFSLIDFYRGKFQIGFDSCTVPGLLNSCFNIDPRSLDSCEGARFSMYVTSDMKALPCSFDNQKLRWAYDLTGHTIQEAWESEPFEQFRNIHRNACPGCEMRHECRGGCPICPQVVLCEKRKERN